MRDRQVVTLNIKRLGSKLNDVQGLNGGTTVAGTMVVAHAVGIPIFVTGGIGGVHRDAEKSV